MSQTTAPAPSPLPTITYDEFAKIDFRVATVVNATDHSNADKLLVLTVCMGFDGENKPITRTICAGLKANYKPEELVGKQVIIVANLATRNMRGVNSEGMLMASTDQTAGLVQIITTQTGNVVPGSGVK